MSQNTLALRINPGAWPKGQKYVEDQILDGNINKGSADLTQVEELLAAAEGSYKTGKYCAEVDLPTQAIKNLWDAIKFACDAILVKQGLQFTGEDDHIGTLNIILNQFNSVIKGELKESIEDLRIRRNEVGYPFDKRTGAQNPKAQMNELPDFISTVALFLKAAPIMVEQLKLFLL